jgi:hypothetical protein
MSKTIKTSNANLLEDASSSSLSSSATAAAGTISVYSITDFAVKDSLLIGEFGQEGSEIIATHTTTAPSGALVTLASNLVKSHPKDTKVYVLPYNYVQFFRSTTTTGDKTQLGSNVAISSENIETIYTDTTNSTGYAFTRFYDSLGNTYSDYSDPIPYGGLGSNTVGYAINLAMKEMKKEFSDVLTYEMLVDEINACLRYVRGKLKRWSNVQEFDYVVDQMNRGEYSWALPTTYYDKNSNRSMLQVRVGTDYNLTYKDKKEFDEYFYDVVKTTVATTASSGATSIVLTSSDDFPETGTFHVYVGNTVYDITVSANAQDTNTLTCTATTVEIPAGTNIFYGESEDTPEYFSVWDGYLYIWPLCGSTNYGYNIFADFYTDIVEIDSDADELTLARFDMIKHWLKWQIRNITEKNGNPDFKDGDWVLFNSILNDAVRRESSGQKFKMKPTINKISYRRESNSNFDIE